MALVKCAECKHKVSNWAKACPNCGYTRIGDCKDCIYYEEMGRSEKGICKAAETIDYVSKYKAVCPGVVKKPLFNLDNIQADMH